MPKALPPKLEVLLKRIQAQVRFLESSNRILKGDIYV